MNAVYELQQLKYLSSYLSYKLLLSKKNYLFTLSMQ